MLIEQFHDLFVYHHQKSKCLWKWVDNRPSTTHLSSHKFIEIEHEVMFETLVSLVIFRFYMTSRSNITDANMKYDHVKYLKTYSAEKTILSDVEV